MNDRNRSGIRRVKAELLLKSVRKRLDLHMPGMSGLQVLRKIRGIRPAAIVMIFTGDQSEASVRDAQKLRVTEFYKRVSRFKSALLGVYDFGG